jgi:hypothetical protein
MVINIIGIAEMPIIFPKEVLPKYSPRIAVVIGARAPNPIPYMMTNNIAE